MDGFTGRLLRVDLTRGRLAVEEWDLGLAQTLLGGRGLAAKILGDEVRADAHPLSPENKLVLMAGPLTGSGSPCGCVVAAVSKSPLTGTIACGAVKGHFGAELKHAGLDGLIIEGRSKFPVYLALLQGQMRLLPALQLWGRTTANTEELIRAELKDSWLARETRILSIGPAGEKQALMATLVNEDYLVQGAAGLGAVMGSKKLKAVAVQGVKGVSVANGTFFIGAVSSLISKLSAAHITSEALPRLGTPFLLQPLARHGALPVDNFSGSFEGRRTISGQRLADYYTHRRSCFACPIGCRQFTEVHEKGFAGRGKGPEYDALAQFGAACGVESLPAILQANYLCTALGLDPVSAGATVACAISLQREGCLSEAGCKLSFGSPETLLACLRSMGGGEGFGKRLAAGSRRLAEEVGRPEAFLGSKGLELPPYDVRAIQGLGLNFATSNFGAFDLNGFTVIDEILGVHAPSDPLDPEGKAAQVKHYQDAAAALDSMGVCILPLMGVRLRDLVPVFRAVTGMGLGIEDILRAGERTWNLERLFNLEAGVNGSADRLPQRMVAEAMPSGPARGRVCELGKMLPEYYRLRGWDSSGRPGAATLASLGLG
jgi:aldehyde:ferredoxin oxidoreductase